MTNETAYCPSCGAAQVAGRNFCSNCGERLTGGAPLQQSLAQVGLEVQSLWLKLVVGRAVGAIAGLAIWWLVVGPVLGSNVVTQIIAIALHGFAGLVVGQTILLQSIAGRR